MNQSSARNNPWQEIRRLQREIAHLFDDLGPAGRWPLTGDYPPVALARTDEGLTIEALCPGVDRSTLDVTVVGDAVTIKCERKPEPDVPLEHYHRRERPFGVFARTISLGERFDPDRTRATYTDGILDVQIARMPEATPKKIQIQN